VTILRSASDPRWAAAALADLDKTLGDHAHCEKKAAASALKLIADHPDRPPLVRALAKLAQEESQHFLAVLVELQRRGAPLPPDHGDRYVQQLLALVRSGPQRLLDRLLVCALVEARSCERLAILGEVLTDPGLRELYRRLAVSEAGHERLFVQLAGELAGEEISRRRLSELADAEARVVAALPLGPRIH
jgi:tRNA 2-(methylsulfanyl)-N6-isopentenyladenosine37 hydroxylase